jgi:enoyl-CoA hydratase
MPDEPVILIERRGGVGIITLNRPAKLNALNTPLMNDLEAAIQAFDADDEIGAVVITGAGERAFSAGGDMKEQVDQLDSNTIRERRSAGTIVRASQKPTLAAVRGYCYGGGAILAINCDLRIAGADARFKFPAVSYGHASGGAVLPSIVGVPKAKELLFTADVVEADEALRIGLVNQVVPPDEALEAAVAMASRIAANSPQAVAAVRRVVEVAAPTGQAFEHEEAVNRELRTTKESGARFRQVANRVVGTPAE